METHGDISLSAQLATAGQRLAEVRTAYRQLLGQQREEQRHTDPLLAIGRKRHRMFVRALVDAAIAGQPFPDAARTAVIRAFPKLKTPLAIDHKAYELLQRDGVSETTVALFARAGLELPDVVKALVELVRGATSTRVSSSSAGITTVTTTHEAPSLEAINFAFRLLFPELTDTPRRHR
jgi:hypothetical protein